MACPSKILPTQSPPFNSPNKIIGVPLLKFLAPFLTKAILFTKRGWEGQETPFPQQGDCALRRALRPGRLGSPLLKKEGPFKTWQNPPKNPQIILAGEKSYLGRGHHISLTPGGGVVNLFGHGENGRGPYISQKGVENFKPGVAFLNPFKKGRLIRGALRGPK